MNLDLDADPFERALTVADDEGYDTPTWAPTDLTAILAGEYEPPVPELFRRDDGMFIWYPGLVHSMQGESASGKSMVCQIEVARLITEGRDVVYVDFESDAGALVSRLRMFGAPDECIRDHFKYVQPDQRPDTSPVESMAFEGMLRTRPALVVIDGVTEALVMWGASSNDNDEVTRWNRQFPRRVARTTGAAVVMVDHVSKSDRESRYAIGAQAKLAMVDGATFVVDMPEPCGRGVRGYVRIRASKDRGGFLASIAGPAEGDARLREVARVFIDSRNDEDRPYVEILAPRSDDDLPTFRPDTLMRRVADFVSTSDAPASRKLIRSCVDGSNEYVDQAIDRLVGEGFLEIVAGPRNSKTFRALRPFTG